MKSSAYSSVDQFIHRLYLGNNFVSKTSFDIEQTLYKKGISQVPLKEIVFVTGLARAGTTALFNAIYATDSFASLTYGNMPFLLMPIIWKQLSKNKKPTELIERAHHDGIKVNSESPEEFDEYFWKTILNNNYIHKQHLSINQPDHQHLADFENYIKAVCLSTNKNNYLSKLDLKYGTPFRPSYSQFYGSPPILPPPNFTNIHPSNRQLLDLQPSSHEMPTTPGNHQDL